MAEEAPYLTISFPSIYKTYILLMRTSIISVVAVVGCCAVVSASSTTNHQQSQQHYETVKSKLEAEHYSQFPPTIFAPGGRLYGVERVAKEAMLLDTKSNDEDAVSCGVFALHCTNNNSRSKNEDGEGEEFAVMVGIGATSPYLHRDEAYHLKEENDDETTNGDTKSPTYIPLSVIDHDTSSYYVNNPLSILSPTLIIGTGGKAIDSTILLRRAMEVSLSMYTNDNGGVDWFVSHSLEGTLDRYTSSSMNDDDNISIRPMGGVAGVDVTALVRRVADMAQSSTQSIGGRYGRMLSSSLLAVGVRNSLHNMNVHDDNSIPDSDALVLWRVDPTGQFWRLDASAVGRGATNIESELRQHIRRWKMKQQQHIEEEDIDVLHEDVRSYLGTLSVKEAIKVAKECFVNGIVRNQKELAGSEDDAVHARTIFEQGLRRRMQTVVIRSNTSSKSAPCIEVA